MRCRVFKESVALKKAGFQMDDQEAFNPYSPPKASLIVERAEPSEEALRIRRKYYLREFFLRIAAVYVFAFGCCCGAAAIALFLLMVGSFVAPMMMHHPLPRDFEINVTLVVVEAVAFTALSSFFIVLGRGLYGLRPWARWVCGSLLLLAACAFFSFAVVSPFWSSNERKAVIVAGVTLSSLAIGLMSSMFSYIFRQKYRAIIAETPDFRPWTRRRRAKDER
jgi:hypothetical protein